MTEIFMQYLTEIVSALLSAFAVWLGLELKKLAQKYVNTQTKKDVARTAIWTVWRNSLPKRESNRLFLIKFLRIR